MRSLSSTLLTNQESDSANPYVTVSIGGGSSETYSATLIDDGIPSWSVYNYLCRDSIGNLYVLVLTSNQFTIYKSTDDGDTWDNGTNVAGADSDSAYPVMIIDSSDNLHILWIKNDNSSSFSVHYTKIAASDYSVSVSAEEAMDLSGTNREYYSSDITVDSNNIPHIVIATR